MNMEAGSFLIFLQKAVEKEEEEKYRAEWNELQPFMLSGFIQYMAFSEYCDRRTGRNIDTRPTDVIIAEIEEKHREMHKEEGGKS